MTSRRKRRACGARSSRCTTRCIATCADGCRRPTARSASPTASRFPRTCSATCGRSSGARSIRWSSRIPARARPRRDRRAEETEIRCRAHHAVGGELLRLARLPEAAADVLGTLAAHQAARPRRAVPRQRVAHGRQGGRAHQAVHRADARAPDDRVSRARSLVLRPVVQPAAVHVPGRRARRLPRSDRRHGEPVDDAGLPAPDRPDRRGEAQPARRRSISR